MYRSIRIKFEGWISGWLRLSNTMSSYDTRDIVYNMFSIAFATLLL
jgi:hypothetical protein